MLDERFTTAIATQRLNEANTRGQKVNAGDLLKRRQPFFFNLTRSAIDAGVPSNSENLEADGDHRLGGFLSRFWVLDLLWWSIRNRREIVCLLLPKYRSNLRQTTLIRPPKKFRARGRIDVPATWKAYMRLLGADKRLRRGRFRFDSSMSSDVARYAARDLGAIDIWVVIPEGFNRFEIADRLQAQGVCSRKGILLKQRLISRFHRARCSCTDRRSDFYFPTRIGSST
ncbi:MAG: hypothetical protein R3A47_10240 [Polyangiales bacterium]